MAKGVLSVEFPGVDNVEFAAEAFVHGARQFQHRPIQVGIRGFSVDCLETDAVGMRLALTSGNDGSGPSQDPCPEPELATGTRHRPQPGAPNPVGGRVASGWIHLFVSAAAQSGLAMHGGRSDGRWWRCCLLELSARGRQG